MTLLLATVVMLLAIGDAWVGVSLWIRGTRRKWLVPVCFISSVLMIFGAVYLTTV